MNLLQEIRREMAGQGDPTRAAGQKAYMKSTMPFHGLTMSQVRTVSREVLAQATDLSCEQWRDEILTLWRGASFREERYAAVVLAGDRRHKGCRRPDAMPMFEEMIVTGAWWDHVDEIAHLVSGILRAHPSEMKPLMRSWSRDPNLWKRRVSIICQLSSKKDTDLELLYANIEPNLADRDFFIRKAIGWALRAYAWTDPAEMARYVRENGARMSGLSRREALKNIALELR